MSTHKRYKGPIIYTHYRCRSHAGGQPPCPGVIAPAYEMDCAVDKLICEFDLGYTGKAERSPEDQETIRIFTAVWGVIDEHVRHKLMAKVLHRAVWDSQASTVQVELNMAEVRKAVHTLPA